ncbi:UNVERIFIED_CONTAM: DNA (cytosine-5)-methyltransferase 1 [Streptomyces graminofaciens]
MSHVKNEHPSPAGFRILDLFAGPGGLDVAAHVLGYRTTGIEWDTGACTTRNEAGMDTFKGDVRQYRAALFPLAQVLTGGPPCQTFTVAGHGAGRRALDKVLEYIELLHNAVCAENADWKEIFRTWRQISEKLRRKEIEAKEVKERKRNVEELRGTVRRAMKDRMVQLAYPADAIKDVLKGLKAPQRLEFQDADLKGLLKEFSDLNDELVKLKAVLEELGDERTGLVLQPLWWVIERSRRPGSTPYEAVVLEQVPAVMPVWNRYAEVLASLGYRTRTQMMHTEAFGVPQTRRRAVLMARHDPAAPLHELRPAQSLPTVDETHKRYQPRTSNIASAGFAALQLEPSDTGRERPRHSWISMRAALDSARVISEARVHNRPPFTVISNYGTGGVPEARGRRDHDVPSATITGKVSRNRIVHMGTETDLPDPLCRFAPAEAGVLQTFPVAYPWSGNDVSQQIGNAVPPKLALHVLVRVLEPELSDEENEARLEKATADLENWKPDKPVKYRVHGDWKGHPLTAR